ncbi:MAG: regulator [Saprospiraceae bacterium]|nr:regulator [Saprospiraceae bacterium]
MNYILPLILIFTCKEQIKPTGKEFNPKSDLQILNQPERKSVHTNFDSTLVSQYIRSIFQDSKGNLWFGSLGEGVVRYDKNTLRYFTHLDGFISNSVNAINEDRDGNIWLGTDNGLYKYDGRIFTQYSVKNGLNQLEISRKSILVDRKGSIWIGTHNGIYNYIPSADSSNGLCFSLFEKLPPLDIKDLMEDKTGNLWIATAKHGVFRYDGNVIKKISDMEGIGDNYAGGISEDQYDNIWFTLKEGICKFDGNKLIEYKAEYKLESKEIWGIYIEKSGIIWITARGSTHRINPSIQVSNRDAIKVFTPSDGLNCCVQSMFQDQSGNMWLGTGSGLYRFDGSRFIQVKQNGPW